MRSERGRGLILEYWTDCTRKDSSATPRIEPGRWFLPEKDWPGQKSCSKSTLASDRAEPVEARSKAVIMDLRLRPVGCASAPYETNSQAHLFANSLFPAATVASRIVLIDGRLRERNGSRRPSEPGWCRVSSRFAE